MGLNDWIKDKTIILSSALVDKNKQGILTNKVLNHTTRTQIIEILEDVRSLILPGIYEQESRNNPAPESKINEKVKTTAVKLCQTIKNVLVFEAQDSQDVIGCTEEAEEITIKILEGLPNIRTTLDADILAAYEGDPAAKSFEEIILGYPPRSVFTGSHI